MADFSNVLAVGAELQNLRSCCRVSRTGRITARIDEDVFLRVDRDAGSLPHVNVRWKLQQIGNRIERDFGRRCSRLLAERGSGEHCHCKDGKALHGSLLRYSQYDISFNSLQQARS